MRRAASIALALARTSLVVALQYRSDFLFAAAAGLLRTAAAVAPILLVYAHRQEVAGFALPEAALVLALFLVLSAFASGVMEPNLGAVVDRVRDGSLDLILLKPADAQLLVSTSRVDATHLWDGLMAAGLGAWALSRLPAPGPLDLAICASFYFVRVDNLRFLLMAATDAGRWPLGVYGARVRRLLVLAVPVGLATSFPAAALLGRWSASTVAVGLGVALLFGVGSRVAWKRSLAAYTSASS